MLTVIYDDRVALALAPAHASSKIKIDPRLFFVLLVSRAGPHDQIPHDKINTPRRVLPAGQSIDLRPKRQPSARGLPVVGADVTGTKTWAKNHDAKNSGRANSGQLDLACRQDAR